MSCKRTSRRFPVLALLALTVGATGCAAPQLKNTMPPASSHVRPPDKTYDADTSAVVLDEEHKVLFWTPVGDDWFMQIQHRRAVLVLTEKGFEHATVKIPTGKRKHLVDLRARTIAPDGTVHTVSRADLIAVDAEWEESESSTRSFHFPKVEVGSILEYAVLMEHERLSTLHSAVLASKIPVRRYRLDFAGPEPVRFAARGYNVNQELTVSEEDGLWHVRLALDDLRPPAAEPWRPANWARNARWVFKITKYVFDNVRGGWRHNANAGWKSTMDQRAEELYDTDDELVPGFAGGVGRAGCSDQRCVIDRALSFCREHAEISGFGDFWGMRKLQKVIEQKHASNWEKALLLHTLLERAGVKASFGFIMRRLHGYLDQDFPLPGTFNHVLVYVPSQPGLDEALWIDPTCESCAAGELPSWSIGVEALDMRVEPELAATWRKVEGKAKWPEDKPELDRRRATLDVTLDVTGDASVTLHEHRNGSYAVWYRKSHRKDDADEWKKDAEKTVARHAKNGRLRAHEAARCDRGLAECERELQFDVPGFATPDGDELIVPLDLIYSPLADDFHEDERTMSVVVDDPLYEEHIVRFIPPAGYELAERPEPAEAASELATTRFTVTQEDDVVVVRTTLRVGMGELPASKWAELQAVGKAHNGYHARSLTLRRKTGLGGLLGR